MAAAITLARAGVETTVFERNERIGGGLSSGELTLPGFVHDLGSSVYPMGVASPFFRGLGVEIPWVQPLAACAHPLDDGTAVMLEHSIDATVATLDAEDRAAYRALFEPIAARFDELVPEILGPVVHMPESPVLLARFGMSALMSASMLAKMKFKGPRARALFAGMAAHSVLPLENVTSAAVGLVLTAAGHARGWPILRGGAQSLTNLMAETLMGLGGRVLAGHEVMGLPTTDMTLADMTPLQLLKLVGSELPSDYVHQLKGFVYGPGAFKVDYALNAPIPWTAKECGRAGTVHVCGSFEEMVASERSFTSDKPFVLLVQPSLFDASRAPEGKHTAWAYCHVPNDSKVDHLELIERQIERFAPGFRECVMARAVSPPTVLERWNPNLVGGDLSAGAMSLRQLVFRPTPSLYRTPVKGLYLCGASTPPGGGVHGMAGYHAARMALKDR
jgi:phytoene dehydrogenase-like protein